MRFNRKQRKRKIQLEQDQDAEIIMTSDNDSVRKEIGILKSDKEIILRSIYGKVK